MTEQNTQTPTTPETPATENNQQPAEPQRPAWLPEKFKTPEDLAKSYAELEKKLGGQPTEAPAETTPAAEPKAVDFTPFEKEWRETGKLSDESFKALEEQAGLPRAFIEMHLEGVRALEQQQAEAIYKQAGGKEAYDKAIEWAAQHMGEAELKAFNSALDSNDVATASLAVQGLMARYKASGFAAPRMVEGDDGGAPVSAGRYTHQDEFLKDLANPLYKTSQAFRDSVAKKLANSQVS